MVCWGRMLTTCVHFTYILSCLYIYLYIHASQDNMVLKPVNVCWNEFGSKAIGTFRDLLNDSLFTDVTLVTEDDMQIDSHRIILSTCSPFFRNIFERNPHQKPLLYLKGVPHSDLRKILDYIYLGECQVNSDRLERLLILGETLQIHGLTQETNTTTYESGEPLQDSQEIGKQFHKTDETFIDQNFISISDKVSSIGKFGQLLCNACNFVSGSETKMGSHIEKNHGGQEYFEKWRSLEKKADEVNMVPELKTPQNNKDERKLEESLFENNQEANKILGNVVNPYQFKEQINVEEEIMPETKEDKELVSSIDATAKSVLKESILKECKRVTQSSAWLGLDWKEKSKSKHKSLEKPVVLITDEVYMKVDKIVEKRPDSSGNLVWTCTVCNFVSNKNVKTHVREHAEHHIAGLKYNCVICGKTLRTSCNLRGHYTRHRTGSTLKYESELHR